MTDLIHHPDFWRWTVGIAVVIFLLSMIMQGIDTFWTRPRTAMRQADRIAQRWARLMNERDVEATAQRISELLPRSMPGWSLLDEKDPSNIVRNDEIIATRMTGPASVLRISRPYDPERDPKIEQMYRGEVEAEDPLGGAQGPHERSESVGATDEAEDGPEERTELLSPVPRFGEPKVLFYVPEDFEEPLRCSLPDGACGGRELTRHEGYYEIPDPSRDDGAFLVVCTDDAHRIVMEPDL